MRKSLIITLLVTLLGALGAFIIPPSSKTPSSMLLASHIQWAIAIAQGIIFICSAIFTLQATFRVKALGGIIGNSLKVFSVGLLFFGLAFPQIPIVAIFNLWESPYFTLGIYWILYLIALVLIALGLGIAAKNYAKKAFLYSFCLVLIFLVIRIALSSIPFSNVLYSTPKDFENGLTTATVLNIISGILVILSMLLKNAFGNSRIGSIFSLYIAAFVLIFIGALLGYPIILSTGIHAWWYTYGLYYSLFLVAGIFFLQFSLKLKYFNL